MLLSRWVLPLWIDTTYIWCLCILWRIPKDLQARKQHNENWKMILIKTSFPLQITWHQPWSWKCAPPPPFLGMRASRSLSWSLMASRSGVEKGKVVPLPSKRSRCCMRCINGGEDVSRAIRDSCSWTRRVTMPLTSWENHCKPSTEWERNEPVTPAAELVTIPGCERMTTSQRQPRPSDDVKLLAPARSQ